MIRALLPLLLFASTVSGMPVITSFEPNTGSVEGNTIVMIHGSGFQAGATVLFGRSPAYATEVLDENTIRARTPIGLPGPASIEVTQQNGSIIVPGFTYTGDPATVYDRYLLPVYTGPVHGAYGSEFRSELHAWNAAVVDPVQLYGLSWTCVITCIPTDPLRDPLELEPGHSYDEGVPEFNGRPGRFVYVPKPQSKTLGTYLRVYDVTREAMNNGTEIRVVRSEQFVNDRELLFPSVPADPRFRVTLRIYGVPGAQHAQVRIGDGEERTVNLRPSADLFDPAYAQLSDFPTGGEPIRLRVYAPPPPGGVSPRIYFPAVWAFITVTNNDTQQITTITPN